jgi:hypothetical protein
LDGAGQLAGRAAFSADEENCHDKEHTSVDSLHKRLTDHRLHLDVPIKLGFSSTIVASILEVQKGLVNAPELNRFEVQLPIGRRLNRRKPRVLFDVNCRVLLRGVTC